MISHGIPMSSYRKFLDKLSENGMIEQKKIDGYYLLPEYEWLYSYVENPDWLKNRLEGGIKKEREYHDFIKNNLDQIEEGLLLEQDEYDLATEKLILYVEVLMASCWFGIKISCRSYGRKETNRGIQK